MRYLDRWLPDLLIPLAYDRASGARVGVFYARLGEERSSPADHLVVRLVDQDKRNRTMYSIKLFRSGNTVISVSKLEPGRAGETLQRADMRKASANGVVEFTAGQYQGFWVSVRNNIEVRAAGEAGSPQPRRWRWDE